MRKIFLIAAVLISFLSAPACAQHGEIVSTVPDAVAYKCGQYLAYAAPWSTSSPPQNAFVRGVDYYDSIVSLPSNAAGASCLDGSTINWFWPNTTSTKGVYGYMELTFGNYDGGLPLTPVTPIKVSSINTFTQQFQITALTGNPANFNILNEFYVTTNAGVASTKVTEVGFFWNVSDAGLTYFNSGTACSTYTDPGGRRWSCRWLNEGSAGRYVMFYSGGQTLSGTLDFKAVLQSLVSQGLVDPNTYVNGIATGVEPVRSSGSMTVGKWTITFN